MFTDLIFQNKNILISNFETKDKKIIVPINYLNFFNQAKKIYYFI